MLRFAVALSLFLTVQTVVASGIFCDGDTNVVDAAISPINGAVIKNSIEGEPTEIIVVTGGVFSNAVNVSGSSILRLQGGELATFVQGGDESRLFIDSGTVGTQVSVFASAIATISGGTMSGVRARPGGIVNLFGGLVSDGLQAGGGGIINVFGRQFNFPPGPLGVTEGTLTGLLSDGSSISVPFITNVRGAGTINLIIVPEPETALLLLLGIAIVRRMGQSEAAAHRFGRLGTLQCDGPSGTILPPSNVCLTERPSISG